ncbi:hypothetical protein [Streptomyces sp. NBC_00102]|uniref:hypothetical protein n=1 Tax=Streptomyces sp. NBC_00102 TaxID=2975652 RepID=UPI0022547E3C|nr:hypothetical protein [Streptomyces sp. NBC_00102]MCX5398589.1 hypothetical protein [Streptomyces sp. NBC_00102]
MKIRPVRRRTALLGGALAGVLVLAVLAGGAEAVARHVVDGRVEKLAGERLGSEVTADSDGWGLVALTRGRLGTLTLHAEDATLDGLDGITVDAELRDLTVPRGDGRASVSGSSARAEVPAEALRDQVTAAGGAFASMVGDVEPRPGDGTLRIMLGSGGLGQADVRPELRDGAVRFTLTGAKMFGVDAPKAVTDTIESALTGLSADGKGGLGGLGGLAGGTGAADPESPQGAAVALGLRPTAVTVTEKGLRVDLKGGPATFDKDIGAQDTSR